MYNNHLPLGLQPYRSKRVTTRDAAASKKSCTGCTRRHLNTLCHSVAALVLAAWPIRFQQIPHNSDNGGKKWLSPASNRCVPATDRNITCSQFGDWIVTITIIAIIIIMIMYFNWGDVTLLQAVLICDTATTFQSHQMMSWVSDIKAYTNQFEMQL